MVAVDVARGGAKFLSRPKVIYNVGSFFRFHIIIVVMIVIEVLYVSKWYLSPSAPQGRNILKAFPYEGGVVDR